jgi:hypothetical protein
MTTKSFFMMVLKLLSYNCQVISREGCVREDLVIAMLSFYDGWEMTIWRLPYHFFKRVVGLKMLQLLSHFLMMVARR